MVKAKFEKESDLCAAFIGALPDDWKAYPETGGFDILLVHDTGAQMGVEAKLSLNPKVIEQVSPYRWYRAGYEGPDFRAVLVPVGAPKTLIPICRLLNIDVIHMHSAESSWEASGMANYARDHPAEAERLRAEYGAPKFEPDLPGPQYWGMKWFDWCPTERVALPEYVPDVSAGDAAPVALTNWKIRAIKIAIILERRGYVTRKDFSDHDISMSRWTALWLKKGVVRGQWVAKAVPDFKGQHPVNYAEIEADFEKWNVSAQVLPEPTLFGEEPPIGGGE